MINNREYSFEDLQVVKTGSPLPMDALRALKYTKTREHINIHGRGSEVVSTARGKKDYNGSMTILQSALEAWQRSMPKGKDITDDNFNVTAAFAPEVNGELGQITVDQLLNCRVGEITKESSVDGDGYMVIELPLVIQKIKYNI